MGGSTPRTYHNWHTAATFASSLRLRYHKIRNRTSSGILTLQLSSYTRSFPDSSTLLEAARKLPQFISFLASCSCQHFCLFYEVPTLRLKEARRRYVTEDTDRSCSKEGDVLEEQIPARESMEGIYDATSNGSGVFHRNNSYESLMNLKDYVEIDLSRYFLSTSDSSNPPASSMYPFSPQTQPRQIPNGADPGLKKGRFVVTRAAKRKKGGSGGGALWDEGSVMGFKVRDIVKIILIAFLVCLIIHLLNCYRFRLDGKWHPAMCPF